MSRSFRHKMKWKLSFPESPMPVYYWAKLIGLAPFTVKNNRFRPPNLVDKLYPIVVAVGYAAFVSLSFAPAMWEDISKSSHVGMGRFWRGLQHLTSFIVTFYAIISFAMSHGKILNVMNGLCRVGDELKTLGIREKHGKMFEKMFVESLTANVVIVALGIAASVTESRSPIIFSIHHGIGCCFNLNIFLIYSKISDCISSRFQLLNERLAHLCFPDDCVKPFPNSRMLIVSQRIRGGDQAPGVRLTRVQLIRRIGAVHLELCDLVGLAVQLFTIPILLNAYDFVATLTLSCYWAYATVKAASYSCGGKNTPAFEISFILGPILKIAMSVYGTLIVANASAATCKRGNDTAAVLFKVWKKFKPVELKNEFIMFSVQTMQKPVLVSAWGIVDLDYSCIYKLVCAGIACLVIMIQMDKSQAACS